MVNGEAKARDINKYLSGTKACFSTIDTKSRGLRNDIASFLILDGIRNRLTKQRETFPHIILDETYRKNKTLLKQLDIPTILSECDLIEKYRKIKEVV